VNPKNAITVHSYYIGTFGTAYYRGTLGAAYTTVNNNAILM
jgi:hypothetical protein